MPNKSVPFSVRLSQDDAEFVASLNITGAVTPSDKIRHIISEARLRNETGQDYNLNLKSSQENLRPSIDRIRELERAQDKESEILHFMSEWLCEALAEFQTGPSSEKDMDKFEARLAKQIFKLTEHSLRLAITDDARCFAPDLMKKGTKRIVELAHIIDSQNQGEKRP
ncbi:hypothetical protein RYZ26_12775 [Terasakiella sp. A23]|uniref:hypothetical protein n=1 Tax=Terasakiella sp. FCG-A23 TaxID=3080561 RepID=UPI00295568E6|nr:hypothetical protein [Terasakiella sp. A23]MDV7340472.1 hypothetical protein [Terasakiella sp. A23]